MVKLGRLLSTTSMMCDDWNNDIMISSLTHKASEVNNDDIYICLVGKQSDGHDYYMEAVRRGASVIVSQVELELPSGVVNIVVPDTRIAMSELSAALYDYPNKRLKLIGVVGTNGKTSTAQIVYDLLSLNGYKAGLIGTSVNIIGEQRSPANMTTPDPMEQYAILSDMVSNGVAVVAMELSAHAIALCKLHGLEFEAVIYTNVSQDHLDYFLTMEQYSSVKKSIFLSNQVKRAIINIDDELGKSILAERSGECYTYSMNDVIASAKINDIRYSMGGTSFDLYFNGLNYEVNSRLIGNFNVYNMVSAMLALSATDLVSISSSVETSVNISQVEGRFNSMYHGGILYVIDYAHTPDGLANAINTSRSLVGKGGRLIVVFGCGGNRDRSKRPIMGDIATCLADIVIVTSDNPRNESPSDIINDILRGIKSAAKVYVCPDRSYAIAHACSIIASGDVLLVAGKGAESYMEIGGVKYEYSDKQTLESVIGEEWCTNY